MNLPVVEPKQPKVTLLSKTELPIETIYAVWQASRNNDPVPLPQDFGPSEVEQRPSKEERSVFEKVIDSKIPVAEMLDFVFLIENVSISWREQAVRHRIGVKVDERLGADIVPDLADDTWWSQSMRILDMGQFVEEGNFRVPESIANHPNPCVKSLYYETLKANASAYRNFVANGVPMEDAREVIPIGATHRIVWKLNLAALMHIVGKRGCWILQLGVWGPIIKQMVHELADKVDPYFINLIAPPCVKGDAFTGCLFKLDNERRIDGEDEIPPCSLFLHHHERDALKASAHAPRPAWVPVLLDTGEVGGWRPGSGKDAPMYRFQRMKKEYRELWRRDPITGVRLDENTLFSQEF